MKKLTAFIMTIVILITIGIPALSVSAAVSWPSLSKSSYCEFTAEKKISVYRDSKFNTRGTSSPAASYDAYIAKNDICKIYKITSSYVYLAYPTSSGYKCGYIKRSALFNVSAPSESVTSKGKVTTYKSASTSSEYGYVAKGDKVYKVGTNGNYTRVIYQAASGSRAYKLGYVTTSKYNNNVNGNVLVNVTKDFAGKKITIKSVENGKYLCADVNIKNTPVYSKKNSASSGESFTVTKITEDGWVGLKANVNGKYLSVNNDSDSKSVRATASKVQSWECFRIYQKGSDYYIKAQANNMWLSVRTDESGSPVRACVSNASTWERFEISVYIDVSETAKKTMAKMDKLMNGTAKLHYGDSTASAKVNTKWNNWKKSVWGSECKGFATAVFYELYGYNIAAAYWGNNRHKLDINSSKTTTVFSIKRPDTEKELKSYLSKAQPGDFIQMSKSSSQHSMIVYSVTDDGIWIYDANSDWANTIKKQFREWSYFYKYMGSSSYGISLYRAK